jgi:hypothetical protein
VRTKLAHRRPAVARVIDAVRVLPGFRSYPMIYVSSAVRSRQHRDDFAGVRTFVLFVGHPRSGHSLVGSLLDAHPEVVISHELDALRFVAAGYRRSQLFTLVLERAKSNAAAGRKSWGYSYSVPGQWQGRYERLHVVGDKRGRASTARLGERIELLDRLADTVQVPVSVVHVVRDPWDNIATMWRRGHVSLDEQVDAYFGLSDTVDRIAARLDVDRFHRLWLEELIAEPRQCLGGLCDFLSVRQDPDYLDACSSIIFDAPHQTREGVPWTPELLEQIDRRARQYDWLLRYAGQR